MQELEEDPEVRQQVALYKSHAAEATTELGWAPGDTMEVDEDMSGEEAALEIPLEELIDELEGLDMQDA